MQVIVLFVVFVLLFVMVRRLGGDNQRNSIYAIILCCFFGGCYMIYDYFSFMKKMTNLSKKLENTKYDNHLEPSNNALEEEYNNVIEKLYEVIRDLEVNYDIENTKMIDYYTMWVHQIKTPIAALNLLIQNSDSSDKNDMKMELFKIEQYVNIVLEYLRLGSDQTDFLFRKQSLDAMIRETVRKHSLFFIRKKISLNYEGVDCTLMTDEKWFCFVLDQILSNALKYTGPGGAISIYLEQSEDMQTNPVLVIEDNGIGIQEEDLPRIYDRGYSGYNGRDNKKSTGIGLYICKMVMQKLGYDIIAESIVGEGTKIKLCLSVKNVRFE